MRKKIIIADPRKVGKSREAAEIINSSIGKLASKDRIYRLLPELVKIYDEWNYRDQIKDIDPTSPIIINIEDFPRHYSPDNLSRLKKALDTVKEKFSVFIVATSRREFLTDDYITWLNENQFEIVPLAPFEEEDTGRLIDFYTAENLQIDDDARQFIIGNS